MIPLAERMRPKKLSDVIGQEHLTGQGQVLYAAIETGYLPSIIFWGPPGVGKTTLAYLLGQSLNKKLYSLSAISSGVKDIREVIAQAEQDFNNSRKSSLLFIDEIHRFNKSQQDALLAAVEKGIVTLIGATTENPSFEVNNALLSRVQVYLLNSLNTESLSKVLHNIISKDEWISKRKVEIIETNALFDLASGDARKLCNIIELLYNQQSDSIKITNEIVIQCVQSNLAQYDKGGEWHYDVISAFIKSIRGSDPNAALYWFARMLQAGEDPNFISRRLVILAAEDIGLANPNALLMAQAAQQAVHLIGWPEGRIVLSEAIIYLACSSKSNSAYLAIEEAQSLAKKYPNLPVPLHLRNAPTKLMKDLHYGEKYEYGHQYSGNFISQEYLPEAIRQSILYQPGNNSTENKMLDNLKLWWKDLYDK